jgi:hypothetical protein
MAMFSEVHSVIVTLTMTRVSPGRNDNWMSLGIEPTWMTFASRENRAVAPPKPMRSRCSWKSGSINLPELLNEVGTVSLP